MFPEFSNVPDAQLPYLFDQATDYPVDQVLEVVGAQIQGDVQESITQLMAPPLAASTIAARKSKGNNSTKPLVDTKVMIGDVNYEVSEIESPQSGQ